MERGREGGREREREACSVQLGNGKHNNIIGIHVHVDD